MIKITVTDVTATRYNETTGDWSGDTFSVYGSSLAAVGATLETAFYELLDTYFWGTNLKEDMPELLNNLKENAEYNTSAITYLGDDAGNYDETGKYLIDLYLSVSVIDYVSIKDLLED